MMDKNINYKLLAVIAVIAAVGFLVSVLLNNPKVDDKKAAVEIQKEKTTEEILSDLTAPTNKIPEVPQEILKSLTPPVSGQSQSPVTPVPKDILKGLTAP